MKVLIFCPTTGRMSEKTREAIFSQTWQGQYDIMFTRDNPNSGIQYALNIQYNYEKMKSVAINGGYDKVWIVEHDIIPPNDALENLIVIDKPIVSGLYAHRHGSHIPNVMRYSESDKSLGCACTWAEIKAWWGNIIQVSGGCMGCLLADVKTFEGFSFVLNGQDCAPDIAYMKHCIEKGFNQFADLTVVCGHVLENYDIVYPNRLTGYTLERRAA